MSVHDKEQHVGGLLIDLVGLLAGAESLVQNHPKVDADTDLLAVLTLLRLALDVTEQAQATLLDP